MEQPYINYEIINSLTGNVIGYLSLPGNMDKSKRIEQLNRRQAEVAKINNLDIFMTYWQEQDRSPQG